MNTKVQIRLMVGLAVVLIPMVAGYVFPEQLWGSHFLLFMNDWLAAGFMLIGAIAVWFASNTSILNFSALNSEEDERIWKRLRLVFSLLAGAFVISTPLIHDTYGDSFSIIPHFSEKVTVWTSEMTRELLSLDFSYPKIGEQTFYNVCFLLSWLFDVTPLTALKYLQVACVMLSIFFWTYLVENSVKGLAARASLTLAGILAPFTIVYHAHTEMYALPFTFVLGYLAYGRYVIGRGNSILHLIGMIVLFFLGLKLHVFCVLLFPILLMAFISGKKWEQRELFRTYGHWALLGIGLLAVVTSYLFVAESFNGTRLYTKDNLYDAVFLPVISSEGPPLDRYNLFSFNHILDYLNMAYLWGNVLWLTPIIAGSALFNKLKQSAYTKGLFLSFSAFALVFFVLNPLLSMPTDWDLFFFPGLLLLPLLLDSFSSVDRKHQTSLAVLVNLLALLNLPIFITHLDKSSLSSRLTHVGHHEFKTYWKGTSSTVKQASELQEPHLQSAHLEESVEHLRPYATAGVDNEFAEVLRTLASFEDIKKDETKRLTILEEAYSFSPFLLTNTYDLCVEYSRRGLFNKAKPLATELIKNQYPNPKQATNLGVYIFLMSNDKALAIRLCTEAVEKWPDQPKYAQLLETLKSGEVDKSIAIIRSI